MTHISDRNFASVIQAALAAEGFRETEPEGTIMVGFARNAVLRVADKIVAAVQKGAIRHFFLVTGQTGTGLLLGVCPAGTAGLHHSDAGLR